ncbi:MAG: hopanoid biosynthesis-associated RND transporter HpnN, partial [Alphaproteobacteria bacterium]
MIERLVAFSVQRRWLVIALVALVTVASAGVAAHLFKINTDVERLIDKDVPWRQDEINYEKAFPQRTGTLVAVIDGKTPEEAEEAAAEFSAALVSHKDMIESVYRPDGGAFYEKNGFLLMSQEELTKTTEQLVQQQGLLGPLAADPSLRGIMRVLGLGARGIKSGDAKLEDLERPMAPLQPGANATEVVRKVASDLKINTLGGPEFAGAPRMRLTGPVAVADDEFATLSEDALLNYSVTVGAIVLFLWLALRSAPLIGAVLITTFAGLIVTAGLGLLMVGELNPISVAFAALFVGLGIDFGIQFAVRYRADRFEQPDLLSAMRAAAHGVGWSLTLAAISLIAGFFAFLPTAFRGVSELGLIAGVGMIVAYLFSLTLLPALIAVFKPKGEREAVETTWLAGVDPWIIRNRKPILIGVGVITLAGVPLLFKLPFDSNPMHLRSPKVESISTYLDLIKDPATSPNIIDVMAPSVDAVPALADKLLKLKSVAKVIDINTFVPPDQDQKLATIAETAQLLGPVLNPGRKPPPPTDADNVKAIKEAVTALRGIASSSNAP